MKEALRGPLLKQALEAAFQLKLHNEAKETPVYILKKLDGQEPKLRLATTQGNQVIGIRERERWK